MSDNSQGYCALRQIFIAMHKKCMITYSIISNLFEGYHEKKLDQDSYSVRRGSLLIQSDASPLPCNNTPKPAKDMGNQVYGFRKRNPD
jgi:hypothetical protein